jgi:hypothetical protein
MKNTIKVIIEINAKFSNGCEWYENGKEYEVYRSFGDYVCVNTGWGIRDRDAKIVN